MKYKLHTLSKRELQVLELIILEYSTKQIAKRLSLSFETIRSHRKNLRIKLDVKSTAGMVWVALEANLVTLEAYTIKRPICFLPEATRA